MVQDLQSGDGAIEPSDTDGLEDLFAELTGLPKPSPLGRIRTNLKKKVDVSALKNLLPPRLQVLPTEVSLIDQIAQGSFGKVYRASYKDQASCCLGSFETNFDSMHACSRPDNIRHGQQRTFCRLWL
jgi:hypothetical protein